MGNLANLNLLPAYHKGENNIAEEFYLPCMSQANTYDRAVGFFNSTIYIIAWSSLKEFVRNNGKIRIICSPILSPSDIEAIDEGYEAKAEEENAKLLQEEIKRMLENPYLQKPTRVLAALVAMDVISFRIAFLRGDMEIKHNRLFHDKVGIFKDFSSNAVVFKGSMNETWAGLSVDGNLESIDVFVTWGGNRDEPRACEEIAYFEKLWKNEYPSVSVREFPHIAKNELIIAADTENWPNLVDEICSELSVSESFSADRRKGGRLPRPHQLHALQEWIKHDRRGILEHATGSGKTFTALCAIRDSFQKGEIPIILVPSEILLSQWKEEIRDTFQDVDISILLCGAGYNRWREERLLGPWTKKGEKLRIVISTMQTASREDFLNLIRGGPHLFIIADEVHRLGSPEHRKILSIESGPRLGLSATPRRAGDPIGTDAIMQYFEGIVPSPFTIKDAINVNALTPYMYYVHSVSLSNDEQEEWDSLTDNIRQLYARNKSAKVKDEKVENRIKQLQIKRAKIAKNAKAKIPLAVDVMLKYYERGQRWLVYCDSQLQLQDIMDKLLVNGFEVGEYHSAMRGDRKQTLNHFESNGGILVAIRCLDEGVDIPAVSHALILASSKNPREFIQRRGRVLRKAPNKSLAFIHDSIIVPKLIEQGNSGTTILEGELIRAIEFGKWAENPSSISDLQRIALRFGLKYEKLVEEGFEDEE